MTTLDSVIYCVYVSAHAVTIAIRGSAEVWAEQDEVLGIFDENNILTEYPQGIENTRGTDAPDRKVIIGNWSWELNETSLGLNVFVLTTEDWSLATTSDAMFWMQPYLSFILQTGNEKKKP